MIKLASFQTNLLLNQPETGMGWQLVEVTTDRNISRKGIVANADLFMGLGEFNELQATRRKWGAFTARTLYEDYYKKAASERDMGQIRSIRVLGRSEFTKLALKAELSEVRDLPTSGATQSPVTATAKDEVFKRFSAFRNDRRITVSGGLYPGSYATTEEDARNVETGMDAVRRYALPTEMPAVYLFTIKPPQGISIQIGTVQPAYNQPGGGVEVLFRDGTPDKTVSGPEVIPES